MASTELLAQITPKSTPSSDLEKEVREKTVKYGSKFMRLIWTDYSALVRARVVTLGRFFDSVAMKGTPVFGGAMALPIMYDSVPSSIGDAGVSGGVIMKPDFRSSKPCPWHPAHYMTMGNLFIPDGKGGHKPWALCPRSFLQTQLDRMKSQFGYDVIAGVENEFILYKSADDKGNVVPINLTNYSETAGLRGDIAGLFDTIVEGIIEGGIPMGQYHTECADGQYEITTAPMEAMALADATIYIREVIHGVAAKHGINATFSPKVFPDQAGSASHIHFSFRDAAGKNVYPDPNEKYGISKHGQAFMAGILEHLPSMIAITLPSAASYKRVVPSAWAGVFTAWGIENKETPVRVTEDTFGVVNNVEIKAVDGTANIYLALGAIIAAGLDGMERGLTLPENTQCDPFSLSDEEKKARRITALPNTFTSSIANFKANPLWKKVMGEDMYNMFIAARTNEQEYFSKVSDDELRSMHVLRY
ncbi:glutamine synthetase [Gonapodya prolifera JEL478]|uniref:Glutamine synthetase n=1 Tax=Gonapodya prolifera (strain JEL478) TaxID=1344416 RepID=A0A139A703_GONPJ|nr:glutamine synthetase [Gonapodya prolifera JEL478]|eukprot:KXS12235.1 glutamine synthetase [Gonapodya prolifera JEL478]